MPYNPKKIKYIREKVKNVTQVDLAKALGLERATYAAREVKGDFTPDQFALILKKFKMTETAFREFAVPGEDPEAATLTILLTLQAQMKIALQVMAELLAKQNGSSVTATLSNLTVAVKAEYDQMYSELSKSTQR